MIDKKTGLNNQDIEKTEHVSQNCSCTADPFTSLPVELQPKQKTWKSNLRKATCPGCGLTFWTNRQTELCIECENKPG